MKRQHSGLVIFALIIAASLAAAAFSVAGIARSAARKASLPGAPSADYLACLFITGVIEESNKTYNQEWLLKTIARLKDDKKNAAILLALDSPGGAVYEADEVYLALCDYAESGKPVWAYLKGLAASGAYYIACASDYIIANRNTLTGSIGVIAGRSVDLTGLMERYGVKVTTITAGRNKNMLNYDSPLTAEHKAIMQGIADECYEQFVGIVAEARGMSAEDAAALADGRIFTARQAQEAGLVDDIAPFGDAVEYFTSELEEERGGKPLTVTDFIYTPRTTVSDFFFASARSALPELEALKALPTAAFPAYIYLP